MQIHVDDIETHVTRTNLAEDRVEVGAIVVEQAASAVHQLRNLFDLALEHSERRRISEHDTRRVGSHGLRERIEIDVALSVNRDFFDDAAAHRCRGGIRTVRGLGHDDLVARQITACAMVGADHRNAREFTMRTGHRVERHRLHTRDFLEHFLQLEHAGEEALALRIRRERMPREELRQHRVLITGLRVVLHRARTERIEVRIDREVQLREAREVTHGIELTDLRQHRRRAAAQRGGNLLDGCGHVCTRRLLNTGTATRA